MRKLLTVSLLLTACQSFQSQYDGMLKTYVGHPSPTVIKNWGVPTKTIDMASAGKAFEYKHTEGGVSKERVCVTTFFFGPDDKVSSYKFEGNHCRLARYSAP